MKPPENSTAGGASFPASTVRLHFFGDDFKGIVDLPERVALTVIQSAADPRLSSILALVAEHDLSAPGTGEAAK